MTGATGATGATAFNGASASLPRIDADDELGIADDVNLQRGLSIAAEDRE